MSDAEATGSCPWKLVTALYSTAYQNYQFLPLMRYSKSLNFQLKIRQVQAVCDALPWFFL